MSSRFLLSTVIAILPAVLLPAQTPQKPAPSAVPASATPSARPGELRNASAESDAILATWLLVANDNAVALGRLALQKARNPEVKKFASQMIDEHGALATQLQPFANSGKSSETGAADGAHRTPADSSGVRQTQTTGMFDHAALVRDLGKKCLESATTALREPVGAEFDHMYLRMQVAAHMQGTDMLTVFQTYASPSFKPTLLAAQTTLQGHLEHAKMLCKQLDAEAKTERIGSTGK